jgi:hypothetical protein
MIVIGRLVTGAPTGLDESWHMRIEKMLVDLMVELLLKESVSEGEYPTIYEDAFKKYVIDESCMFRYAKRRNADKRIRKFIKEQTTITLRTKE